MSNTPWTLHSQRRRLEFYLPISVWPSKINYLGFFWTKPRYSHTLFRFQVTITFIWIASSLNSSWQTLNPVWPVVSLSHKLGVGQNLEAYTSRHKCSPSTEFSLETLLVQQTGGEFKPEVHKSKNMLTAMGVNQTWTLQELRSDLMAQIHLFLGKRSNH